MALDEIKPFSAFPETPNLDHLVRYLSTWSGTDKVLMSYQYSSKLLIYILRRRQLKSQSADSLAGLSAIVSDARILLRFWGLLPIFQWLRGLEQTKSPTSARLHTIERLQGYSMLLYYPLEHTYYLAAHKIIKMSTETMNKIGLWSCRFWLVYVVLQLSHLYEESRILTRQVKAIRQRRASSKRAPTQEQGQVQREEDREVALKSSAIFTELVINTGYAPLTLHWSLPQGIFTNDVWVGLFGTIAALGQLRAGWRATA
ncbi:uncharacterized protein L969DRAFT_44932 [Mixia osmundae IAM 14324]|uniref:Peroxisomal biogenesis factor 11 n=1 Tax=Mixia osmundae (strain CBS 9802 / IAM 14324 / JCM 22182 / KY 12970) TaxID=764103 RepID=G7DXK6_MIXOS|nr:uncharacterized protein L969DRAFT_44932 [Mixia osmundae IAM 14324]KEI41190.1 hypothetical protein L969DRAFT_44932 [Mixia osmundae IAM 14324]GAA95316.1 hypothetical protein E5Q_01973 [Mixia osmundae IAM 14324]